MIFRGVFSWRCWTSCVSAVLYLACRVWVPFAVATDAAPLFGFGTARAPCAPSLSRSLAAWCAVDGHGFIPQGVDLESASVWAVTRPVHMSLRYNDFVPQLRVQAQKKDDSPALEATAVTLTARRLIRASRNHRLRVVHLLDAQALMFALQKGRSSGGVFKVQLQKIAALYLGADIQGFYGYVPTSCNPADPPSRGLQRSCPQLEQPNRDEPSWTLYVRSVRRSLRHLRASPARGLPLSLRHKEGFDSSSSGSVTTQPRSCL